MKNHVWGWIIGSAIFAMVAGIWVWQLPNIIKRAGRGDDSGLSKIMSAVNGTKNTVSPDLQKVQKQMDANLQKIGRTITAQAAQAAVVDDLKKKISSNNNEVKAATVLPANK
jgi:hypothetical protein